jgi:hypothetical protein
LYGCERSSIILRGRGSNRRLAKTANNELHDLYSSSDIVGVIETREMSWAGLMAREEVKRKSYSVLVE